MAKINVDSTSTSIIMQKRKEAGALNVWFHPIMTGCGGTLWELKWYQGARPRVHTCPVETMTGSVINSRDIGQRKSSGITGAL